MDFNNKGYGKIPLFGDKFVIFNDTVFATWVIGFVLILFAIVVRLKLKRFKDVPESKFQNIVETMVETMENFCVGQMSEKYSYFGFWFFGVFAFILLSNLSGLVGLRPPTADLATTAAFGLSTFFLIHFMGITTQKKDYVKGYFEPVAFFFPLNILGTIATPISLSFRLFGNILGGLIIMGLIYNLFPWFLKLGVPAVLHLYFDVFAGCLQAFIFTILSMTFIRDKTPE